MVSDHYIPQVTDYSKRELSMVLSSVKSPSTLIGGWAVYFHVNKGFEDRHARDYIGSRDIDLGVHVDPKWDKDELENSPVGVTLKSIETDLGYLKSRFGFVKYFERETGEQISEEESKELPLFEIFPVYIDIIPDTGELDAFRRLFGFEPPSETLLGQAFDNGKNDSLERYVDWDTSVFSTLCDAELLAAMKIRSIPGRDKEHKRVKDICDLHALLWYKKDINEMVDGIKKLISKEDLTRLRKNIDEELFMVASNLIGVNMETLKGSIQRLI